MSPPEVSRNMGDHITYFRVNKTLLVPQGGPLKTDRLVTGGHLLS